MCFRREGSQRDKEVGNVTYLASATKRSRSGIGRVGRCWYITTVPDMEVLVTRPFSKKILQVENSDVVPEGVQRDEVESVGNVQVLACDCHWLAMFLRAT